MLAEIQLRLGAAAAGLQLLHESLPLLLEHAPFALQAHALLVLGKARLALASQASEEVGAHSRVAAAAAALEHSLRIFRRIEAYRRAKEVRGVGRDRVALLQQSGRFRLHGGSSSDRRY